MVPITYFYVDYIWRLKFGILILQKGLHGYLKIVLVAPQMFLPMRKVCIWVEIIGIIWTTSCSTKLYFKFAEQCHHIHSFISLIFKIYWTNISEFLDLNTTYRLWGSSRGFVCWRSLSLELCIVMPFQNSDFFFFGLLGGGGDRNQSALKKWSKGVFKQNSSTLIT